MTVWLRDLIYLAHSALQQPNQSVNIMTDTVHCLRCIFHTYVVLVGSSPIITGVVSSYWLVCYLLPSYTFDFSGGSWDEIQHIRTKKIPVTLVYTTWWSCKPNFLSFRKKSRITKFLTNDCTKLLAQLTFGICESSPSSLWTVTLGLARRASNMMRTLLRVCSDTPRWLPAERSALPDWKKLLSAPPMLAEWFTFPSR